MLGFEVAEMHVDARGGQGANVSLVTRESLGFIAREVFGVGGEVMDYDKCFGGAECVEMRASESRDVEPFHRRAARAGS